MNKKKLERNKDNAMVAGVIAGFADYFDQDPVLLRIVTILLLFLTGILPGLGFYIVAWVLMPEKKTSGFDYEVKE